jgi:hypothetical protein
MKSDLEFLTEVALRLRSELTNSEWDRLKEILREQEKERILKQARGPEPQTVVDVEGVRYTLTESGLEQI